MLALLTSLLRTTASPSADRSSGQRLHLRIPPQLLKHLLSRGLWLQSGPRPSWKDTSQSYLKAPDSDMRSYRILWLLASTFSSGPFSNPEHTPTGEEPRKGGGFVLGSAFACFKTFAESAQSPLLPRCPLNASRGEAPGMPASSILPPVERVSGRPSLTQTADLS